MKKNLVSHDNHVLFSPDSSNLLSNECNVVSSPNAITSPTRIRKPATVADMLSFTPHRPSILTSSTPKSRGFTVSETPKSDFMSFVENVLSPIVIGVSPMHSMSPPHDGSTHVTMSTRSEYFHIFKKNVPYIFIILSI